MKELEISNLSKRFIVNRKEIPAFEDVQLTISQGELITIVGPSGCGKSTLLRCIASFDPPSDGVIRMNGRVVQKPSKDRMVVFQSFDQLFPWMTVLKNIIYAIQATEIPLNKKSCQSIALKYLDLVGLAEFKDYYPYQLSGGMKQRVAIARALAVQPKILLMDEPFGSLDALTRNILQHELEQIWRKTGITILFVTHSIEEAILLSDEIVVFEGHPGRIKAILPNPLPRPRSPEMEGFSELWHQLNSHMGIVRSQASKTELRRITLIGEAEIIGT